MNCFLIHNIKVKVTNTDELKANYKKLEKNLQKDYSQAPMVMTYLTIINIYPIFHLSLTYIILIVHVTVASTERNFSKLKFLKFYLESNMSQ